MRAPIFARARLSRKPANHSPKISFPEGLRYRETSIFRSCGIHRVHVELVARLQSRSGLRKRNRAPFTSALVEQFHELFVLSCQLNLAIEFVNLRQDVLF